MLDLDLPAGRLPDHVSASFFPNVYEQRPAHRVLPWQRLAERLIRFQISKLRGDDDKLRLPLWSPASFASDDSSSAEQVTALSCLVLDIDDGTSIERAWDRCEGLTAALHTSWRHTTDAPRFRVVLPLVEPVPVWAWSTVWETAVRELGLQIDENCKNVNRRYVLPACRGESADRRVESRVTGTALDLSGLVPDAPPPTPQRRPRTSRPIVVPHHRRQRAIRRRFSSDPVARRRVAEQLGARVTGKGSHERAEHLACPDCDRPSVWFWIAPDRASRARCRHERSCGWSDALDGLVGVLL